MILELTSAQRRTLRARAHNLRPVVVIGNAGLSTTVLNEINNNLKSHELIKIRVLAGEHATREGWHGEICSSLHAAPVQHIGKILVVYRPLPRPDAKTQRKKPPTKAKPRAQQQFSALSAGCRDYTRATVGSWASVLNHAANADHAPQPYQQHAQAAGDQIKHAFQYRREAVAARFHDFLRQGLIFSVASIGCAPNSPASVASIATLSRKSHVEAGAASAPAGTAKYKAQPLPTYAICGTACRRGCRQSAVGERREQRRRNVTDPHKPPIHNVSATA